MHVFIILMLNNLEIARLITRYELVVHARFTVKGKVFFGARKLERVGALLFVVDHVYLVSVWTQLTVREQMKIAAFTRVGDITTL